jgi:hypothetical protein
MAADVMSHRTSSAEVKNAGRVYLSDENNGYFDFEGMDA